MEISKVAKKQRVYYEKHREKWNTYQREYKKRRYSEDLEYRARMKEYNRARYRKMKDAKGI